MFFVSSRAWDKEKKSHYTEPQRLHGERGLLRSSYDTRPAYCLGSAMSIVAQWQSIGTRKSEGLRFDSSRGLRIFFVSHARDKKKSVSFYSLIALKIYHLILCILANYQSDFRKATAEYWFNSLYRECFFCISIQFTAVNETHTKKNDRIF